MTTGDKYRAAIALALAADERGDTMAAKHHRRVASALYAELEREHLTPTLRAGEQYDSAGDHANRYND